ncbi:MAG: DUF1453 family protein [Candidatus Thermoplasmatota archaeon]|nr:DUF1453 family protein [Candidatus Thermoplasmatota archaeon]
MLQASFLTLFWPLASNVTSGSTPGTASQLAGTSFFLVLVALVIARRVLGGVRGRIYSERRVLMIPVIYILLTVLSVAALGYIHEIILGTLALLPAGVLFGSKFGTKVEFFWKNGMIYYRRSPVVLILWLGSFIVRVLLETIYPGNLQVEIVIDAVLSLTAGLLLGEAMNILGKRKKFNENAPDQSQPEPFIINQ